MNHNQSIYSLCTTSSCVEQFVKLYFDCFRGDHSFMYGRGAALRPYIVLQTFIVKLQFQRKSSVKLIVFELWANSCGPACRKASSLLVRDTSFTTFAGVRVVHEYVKCIHWPVIDTARMASVSCYEYIQDITALSSLSSLGRLQLCCSSCCDVSVL